MTRRKVRIRCPCCGQDLPKPIPLADPSMVHLSAQEQALFNIVKANPQGLAAAQIHARIFHTNRWGEAATPQMVPTVARNVNKKIAQWGMRIKNTGGRGSTYFMVPL